MNELARVSEARRALAEAVTPAEAKVVEEKTALLARALKAHDGDCVRANEYAEVAVEAAVKVGELLGPAEHGGDRKSDQVAGERLDSGVPDKDARRRYRALFATTPEQRAAYYAEARAQDDVINKSALLRIWKREQRTAGIQQQVAAIEAGDLVLPKGVFDVIDVDPPWPYATGFDPDGRRASNPYPEMSLEDIASLPVPEHSADNSVLWLWTTHRFMRHAFPILDRWGYEEKAIVTWRKDRMGLGRWLRSQTEFCIMATRGSPLITLTNQTTLVDGPMREHSRKPDEFYAMVESLCPAVRRCIWFGREPRDGWVVGGNEPGKFDD